MHSCAYLYNHLCFGVTVALCVCVVIYVAVLSLCMWVSLRVFVTGPYRVQLAQMLHYAHMW